jgi:uncharacterized repeat protein (TIGR02543 family)
MKLRNFLIVLFALLIVFAFASCKHEPEVPPTPETPEVDPWELYPYKNYTPTTNKVQVITITEGVETDYWNRDKIKIEWEEPVEAGDVVTLKYRSERTIYQWDIRNGSTKWVYESSKNNFIDPVIGDGGWATLTYTFADVDINGAELLGDTRFGIYFRGNFVEGDVFEIMDVKLNGEPLEITADNIKSYATLEEGTIDDHVWDIPRNYAILLATGQLGEVDKKPLIAKVAPGSTAQELYDELEEDGGYIVKLFSDEAKTTPYDLSTKILKDALIIYYERTGVERTVKFDLNGGASATAIADATVRNGQIVAEPTTIPTKEGLLFAEWCTDPEGTKPYDFSKAVKEDLTLYARYATPRTVTFDLNGAEGAIAAVQVADGKTVARPTPEPTNGPYGLDNWYLGETVYDFTTPVTADITLRAEWSDKAVVTLDLNYTNAPAATTIKAALDSPLATDDERLVIEGRDGYFFLGWYDDAEGTKAHDFTADVTGPFTLYAKWSEGTIYRITSLGHTDESKNKYDKFAIWWTDNVVKAGDTITLSFRSTEPIKQYSVRKYNPSSYSKWFHEESGSNAYPKYWSYINTGDDGWTTISYKFPEPTDATQAKQIDYGEDGCGFVIYFRNQAIVEGAFIEIKAVSLNGVEAPTLTSANLGSVSALSCVEQKIEVLESNYEWTAHTVSFNTDGGTVIADATVNFGRPVDEPADPEKEGYVFVGWYEDAEFTKEFNFETPIIKDTTIYAKLGEKKVVTFDSKGGSAVASADVASGEKVAKPEDPTQEGLVFGGWFTDEGLTAGYDFDTPVTADLTLYAKWINAKKLTLNLNYEGAPAATVLDVEGGVALSAPKTPARAGWFFGGWYKEEGCINEFSFSDGIAADTTIYAKWNAPTKSYKYTVKNGGETDDRFQWIWSSSNLSALSDVKEGDVLTFMIKTTPSTGKAITNFRLRNGAETDIGFKYIDLPEAGDDGWITATIVLTKDSGAGFILGLYAAGHPGGSIVAGDVLEIKAVAFNGAEITVGNLDGYSVAADMETIDL